MRSFLATLMLAACAAAHAANTPLTEYLSLERTDVAVAGVGGMGAAGANGGGAGELLLAGVSGEVTLALLYWNGIDIEEPENGYSGGDGRYDEAQVVFDGTPVTGTLVASGGNNNGWVGSVDSAALYRADVTDLVDGAGTYLLTGFADGGGHSTNGVSLIVYFDDGVLENDLKVAHFEGLESNLDLPAGLASGWEHWFEVEYAGGPLELVGHVSDGQTIHSHGVMDFKAWPGQLPSDNRSISYDSPHVDGHPLWAGKSVPQMGFGRPSTGNGLWDIQRFDLTPLFDTPRRYDLQLRYFSGSDALSLHVVQLLQPAMPLPWLDPPEHDFGDIPVNSIGGNRQFTFANRLAQPVQMLAAATHSTLPIVADGCTGQMLAAGASCAIEVACAPTFAFERVASLRVDWQLAGADVHRSSAGVRCAGVDDGPVARIDIAPAQHWFGRHANGSASAPQRFTVTSVGEQALTIDETRMTTSTASLRFFIVGNTCLDTMLAPGDSCSIDVAFEPPESASLLARSASLRVGFATDGTAYPPSEPPVGGLGVPDFSAIFRDGFEG